MNRLISADWRYRHAGLMAISAVGEGCHKTMEKHLPQIVGAVIPYLADSVSVVDLSSNSPLNRALIQNCRSLRLGYIYEVYLRMWTLQDFPMLEIARIYLNTVTTFFFKPWLVVNVAILSRIWYSNGWWPIIETLSYLSSARPRQIRRV